MTSEQLLATRATLWRQKAEPLLTLEDAQSWLLQSGLCLFLPRKAQIPAPAPSFVEACLGETNPTPPRVAIESAKELLVRLIDAGSALPLNLLGTPADYPDFLVSEEALAFVYALRGDRDWKRPPGATTANRVSPLVIHVWKLLERRGVLTASEIQQELGKELTEAAILRALHELWAALRVVPLYQGGGQETLWEPFQSRHEKAIVSGVGMSQVTALSVLASVYLQSVVAAGGDDVESFLSPLASRSKVREVIRGLTATRQLAMIQMETHSLLYVEGSLPEFPEAEKPILDQVAAGARQTARRPHPTSPEGMETALKRNVSRSHTAPAPRPAYKRPPSAIGEGGAPGRTSVPSGRTFRPVAGSRPDPRKRDGGSRPAAASPRAAFKPGFKPPFKPPFKPKSSAIERSEPGTGLRADGTPKKMRWRDMPGGKPNQKGKPARFGPRNPDAASGQASPRPAQGARPFRPAGTRPTGVRSSTGRSSPGRPSGGKSFGPSGFAKKPGPPPFRSSGGSRPPARSGDRPGGGRPFFRPRREEGGAPNTTPRTGMTGGSDRKFTPRPSQARDFSASRAGSGGARPYPPRGAAPSSPGRPASGRPISGRPASGGASYGRPASTGRSASSRPSTGRPTGRPAGGMSSGASGFAKKPGGSGFKPGGPKAGTGSRPPSRPGFGKGPRPGSDRPSTGSRPKPGVGRPRAGAGPKPGGRPPSKSRKRSE